jgi:preprotein translocase subunit SecD
MKSIIYILLFAILGGLVFSSIPAHEQTQQKAIILQGTESASPEQMYSSGTIITNRLKEYGLQHVDVTVQIREHTITVSFSEKTDIHAILPLLTARGRLGFYETVDRSELVGNLSPASPLFSLMNIPGKNTDAGIASDVLGWCTQDNFSAVEVELTRHFTPNSGNIHFFRSQKADQKSEYSLHILKGQALLDQSTLSNVTISNNGQHSDLLLAFNPQGAQAWRDLSGNNIGHPIAIVIDNLVYADPVVRDEIKNGACIISGNFKLEELKLLKVLISNGEIPVEFRVL